MVSVLVRREDTQRHGSWITKTKQRISYVGTS